MVRLGRLLFAALVGSLALVASPAAADGPCPGASTCPYTAAGVVGQRADGVLRFPQTVALGPDGSVYVGDQYSHTVQVFGPDGSFRRAFGSAGTRPGQLGASGGIAVGADGTAYVLDSANRVNRFGADGSFLGSFGRTGSGAGQFRFGPGGGNASGAGGGIAVGGSNVYVADSRNHRVQRFATDGSRPVVIVSRNILSFPQGLAVRGSRLVVADDRHHRLVVFDTGGRVLRTVGKGVGVGPRQLQNPYDVAIDGRGRVFVADDLNHRVVRFDPAPKYRYRARWGSFGTGLGQLEYPRGLAADVQGNTFVANTGNNRIEKFDISGAPIGQFGINGRSTGQFIDPLGVAADSSGVRAVADSVVGRIQLLNPDGSVAAVWGSPAPGPTILPSPTAIVFDGAGAAYVLDQRRGRIVVFDRGGNVQRTIVTGGLLVAPSGLAIDAAGNLYVADTGNGRIARFDNAGTYLGSVGEFGDLRGVAVTPDGSRIYGADAETSRIYVLGPDGTAIDDFGGKGSKVGHLNLPAQLTLDAGGNLWVADRGNNRVQAFGPDDKPLTSLGARGINAGEFIHPTGVSVDCNGLLTVVDSDNNRVQQFALASPAVAPCASLPPVSSPAAPKFATAPPPVPPELTLKVMRRSGLLSSRVLPLRVSCDRRCRLTVSANVRVRGAAKKGSKRPARAKLRFAGQTLPAGDYRVVRPKLSLADKRRLARALGKRKGLVATVQLTAVASDSAPSIETRRFLVSR